MLKALLGKKKEMSQIWDENGTIVPVTIVEAGPCPVTQVKTTATKDGYNAYQIAWGERREKNVAKPQLGHLKAAGAAPMGRFKEFRFEGEPELNVGDTVTVEVFEVGDLVDVQGTSKGRGFQGGIKRHGFTSGPRAHGTKNTREPGSTGNATTPGRVWKGKRMPGHYGAETVTVRNLMVVKVDKERNLIYLRGAVPGHNEAHLTVREAITGSRRKGAKAKG